MRHMSGCLIAFAAIYFLPLLGISSGWALVIGIGLMMACHIGGHSHEDDADGCDHDKKDKTSPPKTPANHHEHKP